MRKFVFVLGFFLCLQFISFAADKLLISGPMLGYVEHRSALIWLEVSPSANKVELVFSPKSNPKSIKKITYQGALNKDFNPIKFEIGGLEMNSEYEYQILINGKKQALSIPTTFKTKELWEWRKPAPNFSFVLGSCIYLNDSLYDRPGKPYGQGTEILKTMAKDESAFNLWLGDNTYLREADYSSPWGLKYRFSKDRAHADLQEVLAKRPNFAIWDDHDFGANDQNSSFRFKNHTLKLFTDYWGNPTYGTQETAGIFSNFTYSDCEFFLMDNRYHRSAEKLQDSIDGKPNSDKKYWGKVQMEWLKNSLLTSQATFKFIVNGNQVLNKHIGIGEGLAAHYTAEFLELTNFIKDHKINGIIFLSGDRHFTELLGFTLPGGYPLYDYTSSPITSGAYKGIVDNKKEKNNPQRVEGSLYNDNNYGKITISGNKNQRVLQIETKSPDGQTKWTWQVEEKALRFVK